MLVLIASLGRAPGVITGTVDALIDEGLRPGRVYIATTRDSVIWSDCIPLLMKEFEKRYRGIEFRCEEIVTEKPDIYDEKDTAEFARKAAAVIARETKIGNDVYISLAGGRKTMSAVMALLGQIYGVKAILHLLVDEELERKGVISKLKELPEEEKEMVLHPPRNKRVLVKFPVFAIPWKIDQILIALESGSSKDPNLDKIVKGMDSVARKWLARILKEAEEISKSV